MWQLLDFYIPYMGTLEMSLLRDEQEETIDLTVFHGHSDSVSAVALALDSFHLAWTQQHHLHSQGALGWGYLSGYCTLPKSTRTLIAYCEFIGLCLQPKSYCGF